jgi:hypothetical protein
MRSATILAVLLLCASSANAQPARCSRDAECMILPMVCPGCPPCNGGWYPAGTLAQKRKLEEEAAASRCARPRCTCVGLWAGNGAICHVKQCTPEHADHTDPKTTRCKTDADCVPRPRSNCGCAKCGPRIDTAVNRAHAQWLKKEHAKEMCPKVDCETCKQPFTVLQTKPVCHAQRCTMVPPPPK